MLEQLARRLLLRWGVVALLVALVVMLPLLTFLAMIAGLAGGMVWQQWRAIQVEAAERACACMSSALVVSTRPHRVA